MNDKQLNLIQYIKENYGESPKDIVNYCNSKINLSRRKYGKGGHQNRRRFSRDFYREIIKHYDNQLKQ